jgi:hypothetical protein
MNLLFHNCSAKPFDFAQGRRRFHSA